MNERWEDPAVAGGTSRRFLFPLGQEQAMGLAASQQSPGPSLLQAILPWVCQDLGSSSCGVTSWGGSLCALGLQAWL